jgi:hypothetical protein
MQLRHALVTVAALVVVIGCGTTAPRAAEPAPSPASRADLASLERTLLDAPAWQADVRVRATGRFTVDLTVTVVAANDNRARIDALGTFDGKPVQVHWVSDGARTSTGGATEPHTTEAIVLGMTRMGVLHNVAMLIMGGPGPDHAAGGAREWVVPSGEAASVDGELAFGLTVDGKPSGDVVVTTAATPHGPVMTARRITVHFDEGDMSVEETYAFDLAVELPPDTFVTSSLP